MLITLSYIFLSIIFGLFYSENQSDIKHEDQLIVLKLEGRRYDKLWVRSEYYTLEKPYSDGVVPVVLAFEIEGKSDDGYNWQFNIPDSMHQKRIVNNYVVITAPFDFDKRKESFISFTKPNGDYSVHGIDPEQKLVTIEAKYLKTNKDDRYKYNNEIAYVLTDTFVLAPTFELDVFEIKEIKGNTSIEIFLNFSKFGEVPSVNYEEELQKRIDYVKKYSDSKSLFKSFLLSTGYKNRKDIRLVFENFSEELRLSEDGLFLDKYLSEIVIPSSLDTLKLTNSITQNTEKVINDKSKHTLVIFSASWCGPCHAQIPLLKDIYMDLNKKLDIVYITTDDEDGLEQWNKLMQKENIIWRSLIAGNYYSGLKEHYSINGIPYSVLVYPDGLEEPLDVRFKHDRDKLYGVVER